MCSKSPFMVICIGFTIFHIDLYSSLFCVMRYMAHVYPKSKIHFRGHIQPINFIHYSRFWLKDLAWVSLPLLFLVLMIIEQILSGYGLLPCKTLHGKPATSK